MSAFRKLQRAAILGLPSRGLKPGWLSSSQGVPGYYVSEAGSGSGTQASPFGPTEFAAALATIPEGSNIFFKKGDTFALGDLDIVANDLSISAYGSGADPIIIGSTSLTAATWTSEAGGYYSTPLASAPKWVFKNGIAARQGESDWIPFTSAPSGTTRGVLAATLNAFNSVQSLVGCKFRYKEFNFRLSFENTITAYDTGTGVLTASTFVGGGVGMPMKLYGQKQFATLEGDWWWDSSNNKLWIKTTATPSGTDIRVCTKDDAFSIDSFTGTRFEGLEFKHYYKTAIDCKRGTDTVITDCNINNIRGNGLMVYGNSTGVELSSNTITKCGLNAIHIGAFSGTIESNTITTIGEESNLGWPIDTYWLKSGGCAVSGNWDANEVVKIPTSLTIRHNDITAVGYMGVLIMGDDHLIEENIVDGFCTQWADGGGIYCVHRSALGPSTDNVIFRNNIVRNGYGNEAGIVSPSVTFEASGVYIDDGECTNIVVDGNTVYNCIRGISMNNGNRAVTLTDNVVFNNLKSQIAFLGQTSSPLNEANIMTGNIIVANEKGYCVDAVRTTPATYDPFTGGSCDNNTYLRPYASSKIIAQRASLSGVATEYTLAEWRTFTSKDALSSSVVNRYVYNNPDFTKLFVNETTASTNENGTGFVDVSLNALASFSLAAFSSKPALIIPEVSASLLLDPFTAANGTAIAGRAPTTGAIPTVSGTHSIQSNKLATSVNGTIYWNIGVADFVFSVKTQMSSIGDGLNTYFRYTNSTNRFVLAFINNTITVYEFNNSASPVVLKAVPFLYAINTDYAVSIEALGSNVKIYIDGMMIMDLTVNLITGNSVGILGNTTRTTDYVAAYPQLP